MKKLVMLIGAMLLISAPLYAYVAPGSLQKAPKLGSTDLKGPPVITPIDAGTSADVNPELSPVSHPMGRDDDGEDETPTKPVPEPGTLAMASMGLIAVGAALGGRRAR